MKIIFVAGGVISGVGKGIVSASIAKILQQYGFSVSTVKIDPYINCDAGTLRPTEHGEVWVTDDGGEIDQDLGNYERFLEANVPKRNNITTGQIYRDIIEAERKGEYLGKTVQFIPHVPEEIIRRIKLAAEGSDVTVVEIGGTAGDYENIPYLFAVRRLQTELGYQNVAIVLVSYFPVPGKIGEPKSKPTQQSIRFLNEAGLIPDFIICRSENGIDSVRKRKIQTYANIGERNVISAPDVDYIYEVPLNLEKEGMGAGLLSRLSLAQRKQPDWSLWKSKIDALKNPSSSVTVGIIGKYIDIGDFKLTDSYISINEALNHAAAERSISVSVRWIDSKSPSLRQMLDECDGIIVPGGFGSSGVDGKLAAIQYARSASLPFLGLCYGMQLAVIEYARNVCGLRADTTEIDPSCECPVIDILPSQKAILANSQYGGTMRLGAYAAVLKPGTLVHSLYSSRLKKDAALLQSLEPFRLGAIATSKSSPLGDSSFENIVIERHRHRYEVNPKYVDALEKAGLVFSGFHQRADGTKLMEFIELPDHPFFVATQAHPEFRSSLTSPAPLFSGFVSACIERSCMHKSDQAICRH